MESLENEMKMYKAIETKIIHCLQRQQQQQSEDWNNQTLHQKKIKKNKITQVNYIKHWWYLSLFLKYSIRVPYMSLEVYVHAFEK